MKRFMLILALFSFVSLRSNPKEAEAMKSDLERAYLIDAYKSHYYKLDAGFSLLMSTIVATLSAQALLKILRSSSVNSSNAEKTLTEKLADNYKFRVLVLYALGTLAGSVSILRTVWNLWNRIALDQHHVSELARVKEALHLFEDWKKQEASQTPVLKKTEL